MNVSNRISTEQALEREPLPTTQTFRAWYGFDVSLSYFLRFLGDEYDSKAIVAVAHKYQFPEEGALKNDFSGGKNHAGRHLVRLGFEVDGLLPGADDWTFDEVEIVVERYFEQY